MDFPARARQSWPKPSEPGRTSLERWCCGIIRRLAFALFAPASCEWPRSITEASSGTLTASWSTRESKAEMRHIEKLLPGYNCGECGARSCREFAAKLVDVEDISRCSLLQQERFKERAEQIAALMAVAEKKEEIIGVLDGLHADFALAPLPDEPSCREDLYPF